jgi:hypothetical protein
MTGPGESAPILPLGDLVLSGSIDEEQVYRAKNRRPTIPSFPG